MANPIISQEVNIEMLEKLADGTFRIKYPKTKADLVIGLTKEHVGLGNVQNYGIATQAEAEAGTVNNKYMTPLRVKEAIDKLSPTVIVGSYSGSGGSRFINVGKTPVFVKVIASKTSLNEHNVELTLIGNIFVEHNLSNTAFPAHESGTNGTAMIVTNGFNVSAQSNLSGSTYHYIAIC